MYIHIELLSGGRDRRNALTRSSVCGREEIGACDETGIDGDRSVGVHTVTLVEGRGGGMTAGSEDNSVQCDDEQTTINHPYCTIPDKHTGALVHSYTCIHIR